MIINFSLFLIYFLFTDIQISAFELNPEELLLEVVNPIATLSTGKVRGKFITTDRGNKGLQFLGVPFAQPPVGNLRFAPPKPKEPWLGTLECSQFSDACLQLDKDYLNPINGSESEDCLSINIVLGETCSAFQPCPVILYIPGGQYVMGSPLQLPPHAVLDSFGSKGVIFASAGFRVAAFGFFTTDTVHAPGNWELHDIIAALKWIQKEIAAFGGDPNKVTLMGHSTGAITVSLLTLTNMTEGLFKQTILMSGTSMAKQSLNSNHEPSKQLAIAMKCATETQWEAKDFTAILECMRMKTGTEIQKAAIKLNEKGVSWPGPQIDGPDGIFPASALDLAKTRRPFDVMTGMVTEEFTSLVKFLFNKPLDQSSIADMCAVEISSRGLSGNKDLTSTCTNLYSYNNQNVETDIAAVFNDVNMFAPEILEVQTMKNAGGNVYLYQFEMSETSGPLFEKNIPTPQHASDLPYLFDAWKSLTGPFDSRDERMRFLYPILFANFAKFGNPTPVSMDFPEEIDIWEPIKYGNSTNYYSINLPKFENKPYFHPMADFVWNQYLPKLNQTIPQNQSEIVEISLLRSKLDTRLINPFNLFMLGPDLKQVSEGLERDSKFSYSGAHELTINLLLGLSLAMACTGVLSIVIFTILQRKQLKRQLQIEARKANFLDDKEDYPLLMNTFNKQYRTLNEEQVF